MRKVGLCLDKKLYSIKKQYCTLMNMNWACIKVFTSGEVNEGLGRLWRCSDAHGPPDAIDAADITWGHLTSQLS